MDFPCYFINRDKDVDRRKRIEHSGRKKGYRLIRIPAVDGHAPDFAERYAGRIGGTVSRGTQACFLSHAMAWRAIADGDAPFGMVCEDDARFLRPAKDVGELAAKLGAEFDIIFVNSRAGLYHLAAGQEVDLARLHATYHLAMQRRRGPSLPHYSRAIRDIKAPGGDGYLLSKAGAARLLAALEGETVTSDVDCWMFYKCLPPHLVRKHRDRFLVRVMAEAGVAPLRAPLRGAIAAVPLVDPHPLSRRARARNPVVRQANLVAVGRDAVPMSRERADHIAAETAALAAHAAIVEFSLSRIRSMARLRLLPDEGAAQFTPLATATAPAFARAH